jgi:hypothetical protein
MTRRPPSNSTGLTAIASLIASALLLTFATKPSFAGDGPPANLTSAPGNKAATNEASPNPLTPIAERELRKEIQKAWRKREERVRTLLLVYIMSHKDGPERARWRRDMAELIKKRAAAPAKEAAKDALRAGPRLPIKLAEPYSLQLFAVRDNRLRDERWERPSEQGVHALLVGLTPGKDCDRATIEDGNREYILTPKNRGRDGTEFRHVVIEPSTGYFTNDLLLLDYRSSLVPGDWFALESARVSMVPPETAPPNSIPPETVPPKGAEPSRVVLSFPQHDVSLDPSRDYVVTEIVSWRQDRSQKIARTVCEYEKAPAPLHWVPRKFTKTWLPGTRLEGSVDECVTVDWATGDDKVPQALFEVDYPDGTMIFDSTEDNGQTTKASIAWKGKRVPVDISRLYSESLARIKKEQLVAPDGKK